MTQTKRPAKTPRKPAAKKPAKKPANKAAYTESGTASGPTAKTEPKTAAKVVAKRRARKTPARDAIVVLGMHRSGVAVLSGVLHLLGCDRASQPTDPLIGFGDRVLASAGTGWDDWLPLSARWHQSAQAQDLAAQGSALLAQHYGASPLSVMGAPHLCRILPFWNGVCDTAGLTPHFALIHRNPLEVAAALEAQSGTPQHEGLLIWLRHVLEAEAHTRGRARSFVTYAGVLQNWQRVAERVQSDLDLVLPRLSPGIVPEVSAYIDPNMRHFEQPGGVVDDPAVPDWVRDTHAILERWAAQGEDATDHAALDRMRTTFDAAAPAFVRSVQGAVAAPASARQQDDQNASLAAQARDLDAQQRKIQDLQDTLEQTQSALRQRTLEAEQTDSDLRATRAALDAVTAQQDTLEARSLRSEVQLTEALRDLTQHRAIAQADRHKRFAEIAELTRRIVAQDSERDGLHKEVAARENALNAQRAAVQTLSAQRADLLPMAQHLAQVIDAIVGTRTVVRTPLRCLADRRKAVLLQELGLFDPVWYLKANEDVASSGADPMLHFIRNGHAEGRAPTAHIAQLRAQLD